MFVLEIDFRDGVSSSETILVRRPVAIIGGTEHAHVMIDGAGSKMAEVHFARGLGREFVCKQVHRLGDVFSGGLRPIDGRFVGSVELPLGDVATRITALDVDLKLLADESPDRAGVRILRRAVRTPSPLFPALIVQGDSPFVFSLPLDQPITIGRSRKCEIRLDDANISGEHARIGWEKGRIWIEDLGSTNGTFVHGVSISGRQFLEAGDEIVLGEGFVIFPVFDQGALERLKLDVYGEGRSLLALQLYPCICSVSEAIRPAKYMLRPNDRITIGRDPANDIWIGAPHISRRHCELSYNLAGLVQITDVSSNGTFVGNKALPSGVAVTLDKELTVLEFGGGISLGICFSQDHEREYLEAEKFRNEIKANSSPGEKEPLATQYESKKETTATGIFDAELTRTHLAAVGKSQELENKEQLFESDSVAPAIENNSELPNRETGRSNYLMDPETEFKEEEPEPPLVGWFGTFTVGLMVVGLIAAGIAIFISVFGQGSLF